LPKNPNPEPDLRFGSGDFLNLELDSRSGSFGIQNRNLKQIPMYWYWR
jgi:hypothetical protein